LRQNSSSNFPDSRSQGQDPQRAPASLGRLGGNLKMGGDGLTIGEKMMNAQGISIIPGAGGSRSNSTLGGGSDDRRVRFDLSGSRSQGQSRADGSQNRDTNRRQDVSQQVSQVIRATRGGDPRSSGDGWTPVTSFGNAKTSSATQQNIRNQAQGQAQAQALGQVKIGNQSIQTNAKIFDAGGGVGPQGAMGAKAGSDPKSRSQGNQGAGASQQNPKVVKKPKQSNQYEFDEFLFEDDLSDDDKDK
jgi:hypothetical protein